MNREKRTSILIVDDTPDNLSVLKGILNTDGYIVRPLPSGELALRAALAEPPDLVLLDIMMPRMDDYEVCARLKAEPATQDIPILFISALEETEDKVKAFEAGGVDYLTKPFHAEEVLARVETHLKIRSMQQELEGKNKALEQAAKLREDVESITRHDLKTPLNSIINIPVSMLRQYRFTSEQAQDLKRIERAGYKMLDMINRG